MKLKAIISCCFIFQTLHPADIKTVQLICSAEKICLCIKKKKKNSSSDALHQTSPELILGKNLCIQAKCENALKVCFMLPKHPLTICSFNQRPCLGFSLVTASALKSVLLPVTDQVPVFGLYLILVSVFQSLPLLLTHSQSSLFPKSSIPHTDSVSVAAVSSVCVTQCQSQPLTHVTFHPLTQL